VNQPELRVVLAIADHVFRKNTPNICRPNGTSSQNPPVTFIQHGQQSSTNDEQVDKSTNAGQEPGTLHGLARRPGATVNIEISRKCARVRLYNGCVKL
jgi:hypothetical protein